MLAVDLFLIEINSGKNITQREKTIVITLKKNKMIFFVHERE